MKLKAVSDIAALVREQRRARGWSQEELARRVGVGRDWVIQFEKGKASVELALVLRTLKELGLQLHLDAGEVAPKSAAGDHIDRLLNPKG